MRRACVCTSICDTFDAAGPHILLVCGISRLKIAATVGGEKKKGRDSE